MWSTSLSMDTSGIHLKYRSACRTPNDSGQQDLELGWENGVDKERLLPYLQTKNAAPIKPSATEEVLTVHPAGIQHGKMRRLDGRLALDS